MISIFIESFFGKRLYAISPQSSLDAKLSIEHTRHAQLAASRQRNLQHIIFSLKNVNEYKQFAFAKLDNPEKKWGAKYPYAIRSWRNNWDDLTVFFQFPLEIRKIIHTRQSH